jgi:hypothetical protein
MNAAFLLITATCLAGTPEPPLADSPALPESSPVTVMKSLPVGEPAPAPVLVPVAEPGPVPVVNSTSMPSQITAEPEQNWQPAPKRFGWFRGLFHRNPQPQPYQAETGTCSCGKTVQSNYEPNRKKFGWFQKDSATEVSVPERGYQEVGSRNAEPPLVPVPSGQH